VTEEARRIKLNYQAREARSGGLIGVQQQDRQLGSESPSWPTGTERGSGASSLSASRESLCHKLPGPCKSISEGFKLNSSIVSCYVCVNMSRGQTSSSIYK